MIQRDYLLRMIEQIGVLARAAVGQDADPERAQTDMEDLAGQWIGLPTVVLFTMPVAEVHRLIIDSDRMVGEKCFLLAELFRIKAMMADDAESRREFSQRALYFYGQCPDGLTPEVSIEIARHVENLTTAIEKSVSISSQTNPPETK